MKAISKVINVPAEEMFWFHSLAIRKHFNYKHLGEGRVSLAYVFRLQSIPEGLRRASAVETMEDNARQLALGVAWAHAQILSLCSTEKGAAHHSKLTMKTCVWTQLIKRYSIETLPPPVSSKLCRVDSWCHCGRRGAENTVDQGAAQMGERQTPVESLPSFRDFIVTVLRP